MKVLWEGICQFGIDCHKFAENTQLCIAGPETFSELYLVLPFTSFTLETVSITLTKQPKVESKEVAVAICLFWVSVYSGIVSWRRGIFKGAGPQLGCSLTHRYCLMGNWKPQSGEPLLSFWWCSNCSPTWGKRCPYHLQRFFEDWSGRILSVIIIYVPCSLLCFELSYFMPYSVLTMDILEIFTVICCCKSAGILWWYGGMQIE